MTIDEAQRDKADHINDFIRVGGVVSLLTDGWSRIARAEPIGEYIRLILADGGQQTIGTEANCCYTLRFWRAE